MKKAVLILTEGTAKVDNHKYKDTFHVKAKMISFDQVEARIERVAGAKKRMGGCYIEIHPNAFATELISMIAAKIGQRYWIINWKITFLRNG